MPNFKKKYVVGAIVLLILSALFIPYYKVSPSPSTVLVKKPSLFDQISKSLPKKEVSSYGIVAPGFCATQPIEMDVTGGELAEILNKAKPPTVLAYNIRIEVKNEQIEASVISAYPFLPGTISVQGVLKGNMFAISQMYNGLIPVPQSLIATIERNGNPYFNGIMRDYGFNLMDAQVRNGRIFISAYICPGLLQRDSNGNWVVDLTVTGPKQGEGRVVIN